MARRIDWERNQSLQKMNKRTTGVNKPSLIVAAVLLALSAFSWAADNSIYIDQTGSNATVTITQDGAGNVVKGIRGSNLGAATDAAYINGDGMGITINQVGAGNTLSLGINSVTAAGAAATSVNYSATGGGNTGVINLNNSAVSGANSSTTLNISQTGGGNNTNVNVLGAKNVLNVTQTDGTATFSSIVNADNTTQTINTSGGTGNSVTTNMTSNGGDLTLTAVGASNTFNVTQSAGGTLGQSATFLVNGSGNSITSTQSSSVDSILNVKVTGSSNTYTTIQR
jgi:hypothetical protein